MIESFLNRAPSADSIPFYHWSRTERRPQVLHDGFKPGSWSRDRVWKPPYICFADNPALAWSLSGALDASGLSWDLWMTWSDAVTGYEVLFFDGLANQVPKEYRVYERIHKRKIWLVGTRQT